MVSLKSSWSSQPHLLEMPEEMPGISCVTNVLVCSSCVTLYTDWVVFNNRHSFLTVLESGKPQVRCRQIWCVKATHNLVCLFPVTSHVVRGQGAFSVVVCKGTHPIMRLHPPDLSASIRPNSSSHLTVVRFLYEDA